MSGEKLDLESSVWLRVIMNGIRRASLQIRVVEYCFKYSLLSEYTWQY